MTFNTHDVEQLFHCTTGPSTCSTLLHWDVSFVERSPMGYDSISVGGGGGGGGEVASLPILSEHKIEGVLFLL